MKIGGILKVLSVAKKLKVPFARTRIAVSIENNALRIVALKGDRIVAWETQPMPAEAVKDGVLAEPGIFQETVMDAVVRMRGIKGEISVCLSGNRVLFRNITLPPLKGKLLNEAIAREARRELPVEMGQLHLFSQVYLAAKDRLEVLLVGVRKETYDSVYEALKAVKIKPQDWELKPIALMRAVGKKDVVILDVSPDSADLVLVINGVPELVRSMPTPEFLSVEDRATRLATDVAQSVEYFRANQTKYVWDPETPIVLMGEIAGNQAFFHNFGIACAMPLEQFKTHLKSPTRFPSGIYAAAIGVALKKGKLKAAKTGPAAIDFPILPSQYKAKSLPFKTVAVAGSLAMVATFLFPMFQSVASANEKLDTKQAELTRLQVQATTAREILGKRNDIQKQTDEAKKLAASIRDEKSSLDALGIYISQDLFTAISFAPPGIRVSTFATKGTQETLAGDASNNATVINYAQLLEKSGKFDKVLITSLLTRTMTTEGGEDVDITSFVISAGKKSAT